MRLHALVGDLETARRAAEGGATVIQLRMKGARTEDVIAVGREVCQLVRPMGLSVVINDDLEAARALPADYVHLGREDLNRWGTPPIPFGLSAATVREAAVNEFRGAAYIGAGPVWATPSKPDADEPIGLDGLALIASQVSVPVIAIGGVDASNAGDCIRAGAAGVAAIRAVAEIEALRAAVDEALAAR